MKTRSCVAVVMVFSWGCAGDDPATPECGNGQVDKAVGEICDDGANNSNEWSRESHCNATCTGVAPFCGDGTIDVTSGEICDAGAANGGSACDAACGITTPACDFSVNTGPSLPRPGVHYPPENPHTDEKAILGKILFWDEQLSSDDSVACGTCHRPGAGGSDPRSSTTRHPGPDQILGTADDPHGSQGIRRCEVDEDGHIVRLEDPVFGYEPQVTSRRAPSYLDAMYSPSLFWDGRATSQFVDPDTQEVAIAAGGALESQAVGPPLNDAEMACEGRTWADIHAKLERVTPLALATNIPPDMQKALCLYPTYPALFEQAFGDAQITTRRIAFAIATHERTLVSEQTPFHRYVDGDASALTEAEKRALPHLTGTGACVLCHRGMQFSSHDFRNIGFRDPAADRGLGALSGDPADDGKFKTPVLLNVGLREAQGLLHHGTGVGADLDSVMNAYKFPPFPPGENSNTDPSLPILLPSQTLDDIAQFMRRALTDPRVASESYPFDRPTLASE
ncbi:MAG: cytochrome c peroxidase [Myxococcota bacterium]